VEEVKRKRGRPRKVLVEAAPPVVDPIDRQLHPPGGQFEVGDVGAYVLGTEVFYFRVRERREQPDGTYWLVGEQGGQTTTYVPEREARRRRVTVHETAV
jgi:hypothetical protein